jgi:hypothetical protein
MLGMLSARTQGYCLAGHIRRDIEPEELWK